MTICVCLLLQVFDPHKNKGQRDKGTEAEGPGPGRERGLPGFGAPPTGAVLVSLCLRCRLCLPQVWKRSGAWFYKGLPKYITPLKSSSKPTEVHSQPRQSEPAVSEAEGVGTSHSFTWARGKGWSGAPCPGGKRGEGPDSCCC